MSKISYALILAIVASFLVPAASLAQDEAPSAAPPVAAAPAAAPASGRAGAGAPASAPSGQRGTIGAPPPPPPTDPTIGAYSLPSEDWLTFGHDQQRTAWNNAETTLTKQNVSGLKLLWSTQLTPGDEFSLAALTSPVVMGGVSTAEGVKTLAFVVAANGDTIYAIDADSGKIIWQRSFPTTITPQRTPTWLCSDTEQATPTIDPAKGIIYFTSIDGNLHGLSLADGIERITPTPIVLPYSRNWSLNLIDNYVYTSAGRGCGGTPDEVLEEGTIAAANVSDPNHITVQKFYTSHVRNPAPWNRGGPVRGPEGVMVQLANGTYDPLSGVFGPAVLAVALGARGLNDTYLPPNWRYLDSRDGDLGSGSPVVFPFKGQAFVVTGAKESVIYLLDGNAIGGGAPEHSTNLYQVKIGNDKDAGNSFGFWGSVATYQNDNGDRYVYIPMWGPPSTKPMNMPQNFFAPPQYKYTYGDAPHGSVIALQVMMGADKKFSLAPAWISRDMLVPDAPAVANGVVFAVATGEQVIQNPPLAANTPRDPLHPERAIPEIAAKYRATPVSHEILYALDAETGKELYSSKDLLKSWVHFTEPVVAYGKVFVVSHDGHVYAFGLNKGR